MARLKLRIAWPAFPRFLAARGAKALQHVNRAVDGHFAQLDEALIWLQIGIEDFSGDFFGTMDHGLWRHGPHPAQLGVKTDQTRDVSFAVLQRVYVALGGLLDEIPVEDLPATLLVMQPLGADLASVVQPIRNSTCQAANSCSGQSGERGDDGRVQRASLLLWRRGRPRPFGNQPRAALPRQIRPEPLRLDAEPVLKLWQREYV
jgi:hypothetical protein